MIVTSATIDTERFARHFADDGVDAPDRRGDGPHVPGRGALPAVRRRARRTTRDQVQAIVDAVDELAGEGPATCSCSSAASGRSTTPPTRCAGSSCADTEVLPLYARLSSAEQHRIFQPHRGRRIVLATNVAETSLTVPGVRYVVDAGTARISRYSRRLKVQRLPIEPVSQASANQRAGRCGRVAPGICIRLYGEDDFAARPEFTEPEILRTNLASVILQMTAIGLGDVAAFPFVEPPDRAVDPRRLPPARGARRRSSRPSDDGARRLTPIGRRLARLPIDPRLGRMVLEAERHGCVREVLVIAAALSIQDPRERPTEHREAADELHRRFDVDGSDLLSIVRAVGPPARAAAGAVGEPVPPAVPRPSTSTTCGCASGRTCSASCARSPASSASAPAADAGHPDHVHQAVLAGLLSHIGMRDRRRAASSAAPAARRS